MVAVTAEAAGRRVDTLLVVDDTLNVPRVFRTLAAQRRVLHARGLAEARRTLETEPVDMAVVDLWMPPDNGLDLLVEIQAGYPHVPVIMMSGLWTPQAMQIAFRAGMLDCVDKQDAHCVQQVESLVAAWEAGQTPAVDPRNVVLPTLDDVRETYVRGLLAVCGGNVSATAEVMGVERTSLQRRLKADRERDQTRQAAETERLRTTLERVSGGKQNKQ